MTNPYDDDKTREFNPATPPQDSEPETLAYSQTNYAQDAGAQEPFPTFGTAEQAADLGAVLVPQDSETGKVILTYRRWAAEQGILDRDVNNIDRFIDLVPPPAGKTPDNVRSILVRWANGEIMLEEQKSKTPLLIGIVAGAAILLLVVAGVLLFSSKDKEDETPAPDVSSTQVVPPKTVDETTKAPTPKKTSAKPTREKTETTKKPAPKVTVPNVEGKTLASATQILNSRGIRIEAVYTEDNEEFSGNAKKAIVITTNPGSGTELDKQDASVSVVVQPLQTTTPKTSTTEKTTTPAEETTDSSDGSN